MRSIKLLTTIFSCIALFSCTSLKPVIVTKNSSLNGYEYVYITPTTEITSSNGNIYGNTYGTYGYTETKSINPSDVIAGYFLKKDIQDYLRSTQN